MYEEDVLKEIKRFINTHLQEEITLKKISDTICYSEEYTSRFFKKMTGQNLFDFIREKRLLKAAEELQARGGNILSLALNFGFQSHEGFSRAFSSYFGLTPVKFRKWKPEINSFMPRGLKAYPLADKENRMDNLVVFVTVIERPERKLLLKRGTKAIHYFEYCQEVGCDIWERLLAVKEALYEPVGLWLPDKFRPKGTSAYVQGVEVPLDYSGEIPEGMECITLPASSYLLFHSEPYECDEKDEVMMQVIDTVQNSIRKYNPSLIGYEWAEEDAPRFQLAPIPERGYMEGLPVRK